MASRSLLARSTLLAVSSPEGESFGPYMVYEQIGLGGMATVHRAEITGLAGFRKPVALKRMLPSIASNDEFVRSFVREGRLASHLRHSNVAQTYDLGKVDDVYFIAMELVTGRTLRDMLRHAYEAKIRIPVPVALHILNQICDALDYAHNLCNDSGTPLGIIHRDVSPSNVIVSDSGVVKLIDFGIAKASATSLQMQTMTGVIKGKFSYIAPEYIAGQIDARADLFAVGILAHELLTGNPLFKGRDDMDTLNRVQTMEISPPSSVNPDIPPAIDAVVMTALQRDPDLRWQRASAMRLALTTELSRLGITTSDRLLAQWVQATSAAPTPIVETGSQPPTRLLRVHSNTKPVPRDSAPSIIVEYAATEGDASVGEGTTNTKLPRPAAALAPESPNPARPASPAPAPPPAPFGPLATASEPQALPPPPRIPRPDEVAALRTIPHYGSTIPRYGSAFDPSGSGRVAKKAVRRGSDRANPVAPQRGTPADEPTKTTVLLWVGIAAVATAAVIYFALPFLL